MTKSTGQGRGRYERPELQRVKQSIPYVEARIERIKQQLDQDIQKLSDLYSRQDQLEKEMI